MVNLLEGEYVPGESALLLEPCCRPFRFGDDTLTIKHVGDILVTLKMAHKYVIHRDIRPENILYHNGKATVIDWGFAIAPPSSPVPYSGTVRFASSSVLKDLEVNNRHQSNPADDLQSLIRTVFVHLDHDNRKELYNISKSDFAAIDKFWMDKLSAPHWKHLVSLADRVDYEEMYRIWELFLPRGKASSSATTSFGEVQIYVGLENTSVWLIRIF